MEGLGKRCSVAALHTAELTWWLVALCFPHLCSKHPSFTPSSAMSVALTPGINSTQQSSRKLYDLFWPGYFCTTPVISSGLSKCQVWSRKTKNKPKQKNPRACDHRKRWEEADRELDLWKTNKQFNVLTPMWSWPLGCLIPW